MGYFFKKPLQWTLLNFVCQKQNCIHFKRLLSTVSPHKTDVPIIMKGRLASNEQKRIITEFITESGSTELDWNTLKKSVLFINRGYINEKNISGCILEACSQTKRLDLAKSYMKYVKRCGQTKPNITLELLYIRTCYASRDQLTNDDQYEIQVICQSLFKNNLHLLNSVLLEGIIMGLCCTPLWRDSLEYLKALKHDNLTFNTLVCIVLKAFEETEIDLGWTLTQTIYDHHGILPLDIFVAWFNLCEKNVNCSYKKVLEFLKDNEYIIKEDLAELIREKLKQFGCQITTTMIYYKNGKCKNCNQVLKPVEITNSEFKVLQECFMSNVVIGNNIFNNSSPQELSDFKDFLEITGPFDVIVDGLNLAYAYRGKIDNNSIVSVVGTKHVVKHKKTKLKEG